jgi:hypothetical protein
MDTYPISYRTVSRTTKCPEGYSCLIGDDCCLCEVVSRDGNGCMIYDAVTGIGCPYHVHLNSGSGLSKCTCPVRNELFQRYGV